MSVFGRKSHDSRESSSLKSQSFLSSSPTKERESMVLRPKDLKSHAGVTGVPAVDTTRSIDWVSDKSAKACVMCEKRFNTFKRRRHHCRQCGRVVCWACSTNRLILQAAHFQNEPQRVCDGCYFTLTEKKQAIQHAMSVREKTEQLLDTTSYVSESLLRIFLLDGSSVTVSYDDCSTAAQLTEHVCFSVHCALFEVARDIQDGDQYTLVEGSETISDIVARWNLQAASSVKLVLPLYDLHSTHSSMSPPTSSLRARRVQGGPLLLSVQPGPRGGPGSDPSPAAAAEWHDAWHGDDESSVASSWRTDTFTAAMEETGFGAVGGGTSTASPALVGSQSRMDQHKISLPSPQRLDSAGSDAGSMYDGEDPRLVAGHPERDCSADALKAELMQTKGALQALQKKYDLLRNIHSRQTLQRSSVANAVSSPLRDATTPRARYRGESYDIFDERGSPSKDVYSEHNSDHQQQTSFFDGNGSGQSDAEVEAANDITRHSSSSGNRSLSRDDEGDALRASGWKSVLSFTKKSPKSTSSGSPSPTRNTSGSDVSPSKRVTSPLTVQMQQHDQQMYQQQQQQIISPTRDRSSSAGSVRAGPEMILLSPQDVHSLVKEMTTSSSEFHQLVRTFFHQTSSVENILLKFNSIIRIMMVKEQAKMDASRMKRENPLNQGTFDTGTHAGTHAGIDGHDGAADGFVQIFEMTWALESLYAFVLGVSEEWSTEVRCWLLALLKSSLTLPLRAASKLKGLSQCLQRMDLLQSTVAVDSIEACVRKLFDRSIVVDKESSPVLPVDGIGREASALSSATPHSKGAQALASIRRVSYALSVVVDDLLPAFPQEVGVLNMYLTLAEQTIREDILDFLSANKQACAPLDLLTILSFAERQRHALGGLRTDLPVLQELEREALRLYLSSTDSFLRQAIARTHTLDERAVAQEGSIDDDESVSGFVTMWPQDLLMLHGNQMTLAARHLQPSTREHVWGVVLDTLPDMVSRQKAWVVKAVASITGSNAYSMIERLCAHINNHMCFAEALELKLDRLSGDLDDSSVERITTHYNGITALFVAHADFSLHLLMEQLSNEVRRILQQGLFRNGWDNSVQVVHNTKKVLEKYRGAIFMWLRDGHYASAAVGGSALSVCDLHIEYILTAGLEISANALERLDEDFHVWTDILQEYSGYLNNPTQLITAQLPWRHLITALSLDTRHMEAFVHNEMYSAFGAATIKIWGAVMLMRGESKQVIEGLYDAIMEKWAPKPCTPQCNVLGFMDKMTTAKLKIPTGSVFASV